MLGSRARMGRVEETVFSFNVGTLGGGGAGGGAEKIIQNPFPAKHRRGSRGVRSHREHAPLPQQAPALAGRIEHHFAEARAVDIGDAIMLREPLVEPGVIGFQKLQHAVIFAQHFIEEQLGFLAKRLAEVVVESGNSRPSGVIDSRLRRWSHCSAKLVTSERDRASASIRRDSRAITSG